ncbi:MAG TPA: hypothetical protein VFP00_06930 [Burkholderiales bacterium]|nr:hypothetical protein [Burkholderiales bacterium]
MTVATTPASDDASGTPASVELTPSALSDSDDEPDGSEPRTATDPPSLTDGIPGGHPDRRLRGSMIEDLAPLAAVDVFRVSPAERERSPQFRALVVLYVGLATIFALIAFAAAVYGSRVGFGGTTPAVLTAVFGIAALASIFGGLAHATLLASKQDERRQSRNEQYDDLTSMAQVARLNQRLIASYHSITTSQARTSYRNSQIAMGVGLLILIVGAAEVIRAEATNVQLVLGGLTGLGSAFSAYLSATFLGAYYRALEQMTYFYGQPLIASYLLTAERLSTELSTEDKRDAALNKIIASSLDGAKLSASAVTPRSTPTRLPGISRRKQPTEPGQAANG